MYRVTRWTRLLRELNDAFPVDSHCSFCHLYFILVTAISAAAAMILQADPLTVFQVRLRAHLSLPSTRIFVMRPAPSVAPAPQAQDHGTYIFAQGLMGILFIGYAGMLILAFLRARNNTEWCIRLFQVRIPCARSTQAWCSFTQERAACVVGRGPRGHVCVLRAGLGTGNA